MQKQSLGSRLKKGLEPAFIRALEEIARAKDLSLETLLEQIEAASAGRPLLTAARLYAVDYYRTHAHLPGFSEEEAGQFVHEALQTLKE